MYLILVVDGQRRAPDARAILLAELEDFVARHRACGQLTGDATEREASSYLVWVRCSCGISFLRWVALEEAAREWFASCAADQDFHKVFGRFER